MRVTRRDFLRAASTLAGAVALDTARAPAGIGKGPASERLRVGVIGLHGRGLHHIREGFAGRHQCEVVAVCDADRATAGAAVRAAEKGQGTAPRFEQDLRRLLDDRSIDAVSIATPDHWHALAALWAMQAGKDVYVEKPVSHNLREGRRLVEAARRYGRVCQAGMQIRSSPGMRAAIDFLHAGKLGRVTVAHGLCYRLRLPIGRESVAPPSTVDYDLWSGPAPLRPPARRQFHYDWHWFWEYGTGELGNQGVHQMDVARWGLGKEGLPASITSVGGRFGPPDRGETPNTQIHVCDYGDCQIIFEVRGLPTRAFRGVNLGNIFHGERGVLICPGYYGGVAYGLDGKEMARFAGAGDHYGNFVDAVRQRRPQDLNADILEGHLSSALCHLGNLSFRLGTAQPFRKKVDALGEGREPAEALMRMEEHLHLDRVPVDETLYRVGRRLVVDTKTETLIGDREASGLLTREYRKPFVVPDRIG